MPNVDFREAGPILIKAAERRVIGSTDRKDGGSAAGRIVARLTEEPGITPDLLF